MVLIFTSLCIRRRSNVFYNFGSRLLSCNIPEFGDVVEFRKKTVDFRNFTCLSDINGNSDIQTPVWIRGRLSSIKTSINNKGESGMCFISVRDSSYHSIQCCKFFAGKGGADPSADIESFRNFLKFVGDIGKESIVDICGRL